MTLAGSFIIRGAALLILPRPGGAIPPWFSDLLAGNTPVALTLVVVVALLWKLYLATPLGLSLYAAGGEPGRRRAGVQVDARIVAYALSGLLSTAAGLFIAAQIGSATGDGEAYTLNSIAAAVLGGVGFLGGSGTMRGAIAGTSSSTSSSASCRSACRWSPSTWRRAHHHRRRSAAAFHRRRAAGITEATRRRAGFSRW